MATEEDSRYVLETVKLAEDDLTDLHRYSEVSVSDIEELSDEHSDEDLETTLRNVQIASDPILKVAHKAIAKKRTKEKEQIDNKSSLQSLFAAKGLSPSQNPITKPKFDKEGRMKLESVQIRRPETVDDYLRNFLVRMGFNRTMDVFQAEWYEHLEKGLLNETDYNVPELYSQCLLLEESVSNAAEELQKQIDLNNELQSSLEKTRKERDFHRLHHKRLTQEKNKVSLEYRALERRLREQQPEIDRLREKIRSLERELSGVKLERNQLLKKTKDLSAVLTASLEEGNIPPSLLEHTSALLEPSLSQRNTGPEKGYEQTTKATESAVKVTKEQRKEHEKEMAKRLDITMSTFQSGPSSGTALGVKPKRPTLKNNGSHLPNGVRKNPFHNPERVKCLRAIDPTLLVCNKTIKAHSMSIASVSAHPRRSVAATVSDDGTWRMWRLNDGELIMAGDGHSDWVSDCDFHPSGAYLSTSSGDCTVKLWDFVQEKCTSTFAEHTGAVWSVCFHDTGDFVLTGSMDNTSKLIDVHSAKCRQTLRGHTDSVNFVRFQPFTNLAGTCSADKSVSLWDIRTGECLKTFVGHQNSCNHVCFNLRGDTIMSSDADGVVKIWDLRTVCEFATINCGPYAANKACFDHLGRHVYVASDDGTVKIFDIQTLKKKAELEGHSSSVQALCFLSPDTTTDNSKRENVALLSGSSDSTLKIWSL